ncbi:DUF3560 domain-containing protein [Streptomyces sp. NPDC001137]|uniref:DUF3560 domain-containing protein n=1 Tax=Streptomyces sp. NPDC001137 TaxID=3154378 RepID=UPI0033261599
MTIEIIHTRSEGTLIEGSVKGDGVYEIVRRHGFRYFPSIGQLGIRQSRDRAAKNWYINAAAAALREAGFEVNVTIDEGNRRSFAEAEADRVERAEGRAERFSGYADNAASRSDSAYQHGHQIADGIPMGQPILVGHHSERRARRDVERMDHAMRTSISEGEKASYWSGRQRAAEGYEQFRKAPRRTLRRIERLQADLRRVQRRQREESAEGSGRDVTNPDTVQELVIRHEELTEEIAYWEAVIAEATRRTASRCGPRPTSRRVTSSAGARPGSKSCA